MTFSCKQTGSGDRLMQAWLNRIMATEEGRVHE